MSDLARASLSLHKRWLWFSRTDTTRAWSGLYLQFSAEERAFFFASTVMQLGNGQQALFSENRWIGGLFVREISPLLYACIPKRHRKRRTVVEEIQAHLWAHDIHGTFGIQELGQYLQLWQTIEGTTLSDEPDRMIWTWTASNIYSAQYAYRATYQGSITYDAWKLTWKSWAPPRVSYFIGSPTSTDVGPPTVSRAAAYNTQHAAPCATKHPSPCTISSSPAPSLGKCGMRSCLGSGCHASHLMVRPRSTLGGSMQNRPYPSPCARV